MRGIRRSTDPGYLGELRLRVAAGGGADEPAVAVTVLEGAVRPTGHRHVAPVDLVVVA